ncbi:MAG: hypothetical protein Ct9H300mP13_6920 [Gammaproteobacteria bacterium]|nr:MAG: hypothetical protein Ct9H300mP13_6920 [Gammaproteobacteria bacterium]
MNDPYLGEHTLMMSPSSTPFFMKANWFFSRQYANTGLMLAAPYRVDVWLGQRDLPRGIRIPPVKLLKKENQ